MRALLLSLPLVLAAQPPSYPPPGSPQFTPDNTEGLLVAPNPKIRVAWLRPVHWVSPPLSIRATPGTVAPSPAERAQISKTVAAITAALRATPEGEKGLGFWVNAPSGVRAYSRYELPAAAPAARWPLEFEIGYYPFNHEDVQQANGQWKLSVRGETESTYFTFNAFPGRVSQPILATEDNGRDLAPTEFYPRPRETGRAGGLPVYEGEIALVTRPGRDPWAPVPLGRLLKAVMPQLESDRRTAEQRLEELKKKAAEYASPAWEQAEWERFEKDNGALKTTRPSNYQTRKAGLEHYIKVVRAEASAAANPIRGDAKGAWYWNPVTAHEETVKRLGGLTAAQSAQPACWIELSGQERDGRYAAKGNYFAAGEAPHSNCRPVVTNNAAYFDTSQPRSAAQLLMLGQFGRCAVLKNGQIAGRSWKSRYDRVPPHGCYRHALMWKDLDWSRIAALVIP